MQTGEMMAMYMTKNNVPAQVGSIPVAKSWGHKHTITALHIIT